MPLTEWVYLIRFYTASIGNKGALWSFKLVQGRRNRYQLKAHMRLPVPLSLYTYLLSCPRYDDLLIKNLFFAILLTLALFEALATLVPLGPRYNIWSKNVDSLRYRRWKSHLHIYGSVIAGPPVCDGYHRPPVVCPVVISRKLSKIDPELLWNTVTMLVSQILLLHSDPPQTLTCGDIRVSSTKYVFKYQYGPVFHLASDHSCCKPSTTFVSPALWTAAVKRVRRSEPVVHNHCPLC